MRVDRLAAGSRLPDGRAGALVIAGGVLARPARALIELPVSQVRAITAARVHADTAEPETRRSLKSATNDGTSDEVVGTSDEVDGEHPQVTALLFSAKPVENVRREERD